MEIRRRASRAAPLEVVGLARVMRDAEESEASLRGRLAAALTVGVTALALYAFARPYRLFPSDDRLYLLWLASPRGTTLDTLSERWHPVYWAYLVACRELCHWLGAAPREALIVSSLGAHLVIAGLLLHLARTLTGRLAWGVVAALAYVTSAWTNAYYYLFSYSPMPTALMFGALVASVSASRAWGLSPTRARVYSALAGALLGAAFWSSPSAAPLVALLGGVTLALHAPRETRRGGVLLAWQSAGFALVFAPLVRLSLEAYLDHVTNNIETSHYVDAIARFGSVPRAPFGTLARVLAAHAPAEALLAAAASLSIVIALARRSRGAAKGPLEGPSALRVCAVALAVCALHSIALDALPTTKLGRTHFHVYPMVVLVITVGAREALRALSARRVWRLAHGAALALAVALSLVTTWERRERRFALPSWLASLGRGARVYVLRDDPHGEFLSMWIDERRAERVESSAIEALVSSQRARGERGALVVGPTGEGSGLSVMRHGTLRDSRVSVPASLGRASLVAGYYGFDPAFLVEEEVCEALLFTGRMPRVGAASTRVQVFVW